jgi:RNA 2',3'-cyclic 3'-phosphodiesterase
MLRLFVALRPPPAIRSRLLALGSGVPGGRWQDDEQLHLTLRFVGEVERPQAEDLAAALGSVHAPAPELRLAGVGRFDDAIWAGVAPEAPLAALHRKVDAACGRAGLAPERRAYKPHVTLARFSRRAGAAPEVDRWLADHAALASAPFTCPHLILYQSHLGGEGARYEPAMRWPLA